MKKIEGTDKGKITLYALSTCVWCKKTKSLLQELGVAHEILDVDTLTGETKAQTLEEMKRWNPRCSFPSLVIGDAHCIIGFDPEKIRKAIG